MGNSSQVLPYNPFIDYTILADNRFLQESCKILADNRSSSSRVMVHIVYEKFTDTSTDVLGDNFTDLLHYITINNEGYNCITLPYRK